MAGERVRVGGDQIVERGAKLVVLRKKRAPACEHCKRYDNEANLRHHRVLAPLDC
jgi:hypothetical protein